MSRREFAQEQDRFIVRMPDGMRDEIKAAAFNANRSMNAEIVARLEASSSSLRDQIAMAALPAIIRETFHHLSARKASEYAYLYADAMMEARPIVRGADLSPAVEAV